MLNLGKLQKNTPSSKTPLFEEGVEGLVGDEESVSHTACAPKEEILRCAQDGEASETDPNNAAAHTTNDTRAADGNNPQVDNCVILSEASTASEVEESRYQKRGQRATLTSCVHRAANGRPVRPLNVRARAHSEAVASANRAAAFAANQVEARNAHERALFLGSSSPEAPNLTDTRYVSGEGAPSKNLTDTRYLSGAARRVKRREAARSFGSKFLATFMAIVLAIGLMPLPAFGDDGSLKGVSFNGNLVAASEQTTTTVDKDGNVTSETTQTVVDDEGNVETNTITIGDKKVEALDDTANATGAALIENAATGKATLAELQGHGATESGLSAGAIIEADKAKKEAAEQEAKEKAEAEAKAAFDAEDAALDIKHVEGDFSTQRIVVALKDGKNLQERDNNNIASQGAGIYILEYKNADSAKRAYVRYTHYEGTAFVAPDTRVEAADSEESNVQDSDDPDSADADATKATTKAPSADLTTLESDQQTVEAAATKLESEQATKPAEERASLIALIDTAIPADAIEKHNKDNNANAQLVARVSAINEEQPDKVSADTHGAKMLATILAANPDAKIISIEALDETGYGSASTIYAALTLATKAKADIYNMSFAGYAVAGNEAIEQGIREARAADGNENNNAPALIAAAGNLNQDVKFFVPASYTGVTAVGALNLAKLTNTTPEQILANPQSYKQDSSNFGASLIWVAAESTSFATATATGTLSTLDDPSTLQADLLKGIKVEESEDATEEEPAAEDSEELTTDEPEDATEEQPEPNPSAALDEPETTTDETTDNTTETGTTDESTTPDPDNFLASIANQVGVYAQAQTVQINLGSTIAPGNGSLTIDNTVGNQSTTFNSATSPYYFRTKATTSFIGNYFKLSDVTVGSASGSNKITRLVISSSMWNSNGGIFVHVADTCAAYSGETYNYILTPDVLSSTNDRHKRYTVVFRKAITPAAAANFLKQAVFFVVGRGTSAPTAASVAASGAEISVRAEWAASTDDTNTAATVSAHQRLANARANDSADHYYLVFRNGRRDLATAYDYAKNTYLDGSRGYLLTTTSNEELYLGAYMLNQAAGVNTGGKEGSTHLGQMNAADVAAPDAATFSALGYTIGEAATNANWPSKAKWLCGPEAGMTLRASQSAFSDGSKFLYYAANAASWPDARPETGLGYRTGTQRHLGDNDSLAYERDTTIVEFSGYNRSVSAFGVGTFKTSTTSQFAAGQASIYTASKSGLYRLDLYGAQGGNAKYTSNPEVIGGRGGHTVAYVVLAAGDQLSVVVGTQGANNLQNKNFGSPAALLPNGYNGGGLPGNYGGWDGQQIMGSGGGATHVAKLVAGKDTLVSYPEKDKNILAVAGGGGGAAAGHNGSGAGRQVNGGDGGGLAGENGDYMVANGTLSYGASGGGGSQTAGGAQAGGGINGKWGAGSPTQSTEGWCAGGGGGGWYGGASGRYSGGWTVGSGGGGSSHLGAEVLGVTVDANSANLAESYDGIYQGATYTSSMMRGVQTGDGAASITLVKEDTIYSVEYDPGEHSTSTEKVSNRASLIDSYTVLPHDTFKPSGNYAFAGWKVEYTDADGNTAYSDTLLAGTTVSPSTTASTGWVTSEGTEVAWYTTGTNAASLPQAVTGATTVRLVAQWAPFDYSIDISLGDHAAASVKGRTERAASEGVYKLPAALSAATGYAFAGWKVAYLNAEGETLYSEKLTAGTYIKPSHTAASGWVDESDSPVDWYANGVGATSFPQKVAPDTRLGLVAQWTPIRYNINYNLASGTGSLSMPSSASYDSWLFISHPTRAGYTFNGWSVTGMDSTPHYCGKSTETISTTTAKDVTGNLFMNLRGATGTVTFTATWVAAPSTTFTSAVGNAVQEFTAPADGIYKLEAWGAEGGSASHATFGSAKGGKGGYSVGYVILKENEKLNVVVGRKGLSDVIDDNWASTTWSNGGYNGGGPGGYWPSYGGFPVEGQGGGATHIAKQVSGANLTTLNTYSSNKNAVLIVAGGGGGAAVSSLSNQTTGTQAKGGAGGGLSGARGVYVDGNAAVQATGGGFGGTQTAGGTIAAGNAFNGAFGTAQGTNSVNAWAIGGGGGGWYGGSGGRITGGWMVSGGGGGSGHLGGQLLGVTVAASTYANSAASYSATVNGVSYTSLMENGDDEHGREGDGEAKISFVASLSYDYTVEYKPGDHSVSGVGPSDQIKLADTYMLAAADAFKPEQGYRFVGWKNSSSGAMFEARQEITGTPSGWVANNGAAPGGQNTVTLVAQWEKYTVYADSTGATTWCAPGWQGSFVVSSEADALSMREGASDADFEDKAFTKAPDGQVFVGWQGSDGLFYKVGDTVLKSGLVLSAVYAVGGSLAQDDMSATNMARDNSGTICGRLDCGCDLGLRGLSARCVLGVCSVRVARPDRYLPSVRFCDLLT